MARHPEVHFRLKPESNNGQCAIYLQYIYNGYRLFYSFGQMVKKKDWDPKKERVKSNLATTADGKFSLNKLLDNLKNLCNKSYNESLTNGIPSPDQLKKQLEDFINQNHEEEKEEPTFFKLTERYISGEIKSNKGKDKSLSSLKNYHAVAKHLKTFEKKTKYKITFDSITLDFFYKYVTYLKIDLGLAPNTIAKDISILKVFMNGAIDLGYTNNLEFKKPRFSYAEEETDQIYLTESDLSKLYDFDFSANKKLDQVRDLFVFGSWVGLRFSDFSNIRAENIIEEEGDLFIKMITKKTKELVIIPCHPIVLEIFTKYKTNANKLPKAISNQKFNEYIKEACKQAGMDEVGRLSTKPKLALWENVSSHSARRSFSSNYYLQGFPTVDLMKITGHKTERSFLKYIRVSKLDTAKRLNAHIKKNWRDKLHNVLKVA